MKVRNHMVIYQAQETTTTLRNLEKAFQLVKLHLSPTICQS